MLVIRKEKAEELKKSEQSGQIYNFLLQYCQKLKLRASIDRNLIQANLMAQKLNAEAIFAPKREAVAQASVRPQNIIRFLEKALKAIKSQKQTMNQEKEAMDPIALIQMEFMEKFISA